MKAPDNDTIKGYIEATPLGEVQRMIGSKAIDWGDDACLDTKAYIMACLSEIAYLCVPGYALKNRDRYLIVPSRALAAPDPIQLQGHRFRHHPDPKRQR